MLTAHRVFRLFPFLFILVLSCGLVVAQDEGLITLEQLAHPDKKVSFVKTPTKDLRWLPDGTLVEITHEKTGVSWWQVDVASGTRSRLFDPALVEPSIIAAGGKADVAKKFFDGIAQWTHDAARAVVEVDGDWWMLERASGAVQRLTSDGAERREMCLSPDGGTLAYVRNQDLYALDVMTRRETRLTNDGGDDILNGVNDWVYWEEVLNRATSRAFWWSPDGKRLAFLRFDESKVSRFTIIDDRFQPQRQRQTRYPKVGDPLPTVRLGVVELNGNTTWMDDPYPGRESIIGRVTWSPSGQVVASYLDRRQSWLELRRFSATMSSVILREETPGWQDILPAPLWLADGGFLWESDRSGHRHLYRYAADGTLRNAVTHGDWQVRAVHGVSADGASVWFDANSHNSIGVDPYRIACDGSAQKRLADTICGTHELHWNPTFTHAIDRWSSLKDPPRQVLCDAEGKVLRVIAEPDTKRMDILRLGTVTHQQVPTRDGFLMDTLMVLPPNFDPKRKYPVMQEIYGGPEIPLVLDEWNGGMWWWHFLAQRNYITWICDNRSASHRDVTSARSVHRRLGEQELQDQLDGLEWLGKQGWADLNRVGITGWSYGGFMTAYALTHSTAYRLGISGAPVTDFRLYDCIYAERLMDLLPDNKAGYDATSLIRSAAKLSGHLEMVHGGMDDNVHFQNTVQFIDALQHAGHDVPLRFLPGAGHGPRDGWQRWINQQGLWKAIQDHL
jgi:dipeptidyl-peptidase 4